MIRRFLTRVLILILIAACGYNWLQVQQLQGQVQQLQAAKLQAAQSGLQKQTVEKRHTPEARLSLFDLTLRWKHLRNQAHAFRSTSKKVFHEII